MRIALDAMGSDHAPVPDVEGAVLAAREYGDTILLVGDEARIKPELEKHQTQGLHLEIIHTPEFITMHDKPSTVGRLKPKSSIHLASTMVKDGQADAFVTVGNTGATLAITTLNTLRRIPGVKRPALSSLITLNGNTMILIDIGANADARPDWMFQFAVMGSIYAQRALGLTNPRVGLLSTGEEEGKGNDQTRETAPLLQASDLNFVGNVEPKDVLSGAVDVMVSDGFAGNIFIKTMEAFGTQLSAMVSNELHHDVRSKMGGLLARPALRRVRQKIDPFEIGGAPLLGVNGVVIVGHGRSNALGVKNAIRQARRAVQGNIVEEIRARFVQEQVAALETE